MSETVEKAFVESLQKGLDLKDLNPEAQSFIKGLAKQQKDDFAPESGSYFSLETQEFIARESGLRLAKALAGRLPAQVEVSLLQEEWQKIVTDFHRTQRWGCPTQKTKPPKVLSEDQKRVRELAPYLWVAFQAWIVMKMIIYYFGLEAADAPEETPWFLYLALAISFGSLILFAWRKFKKGE